MRRFSLAVLIVTISALSLMGESREAPSTLEERIAAVETARRLEREPLMTGAAGVRTELLRWWTEVPDLSLSWCAGVLLETKNKETSGIVLLQGIFGAGAFTIEHPDQAADQKAVTLAGIQSALRAYHAAIARNPRLEDSFLDKLAEQVSSGNVDPYLEKHLKDCKK